MFGIVEIFYHLLTCRQVLPGTSGRSLQGLKDHYGEFQSPSPELNVNVRLKYRYLELPELHLISSSESFSLSEMATRSPVTITTLDYENIYTQLLPTGARKSLQCKSNLGDGKTVAWSWGGLGLGKHRTFYGLQDVDFGGCLPSTRRHVYTGLDLLKPQTGMCFKPSIKVKCVH
jgi:hypothetical protein